MSAGKTHFLPFQNAGFRIFERRFWIFWAQETPRYDVQMKLIHQYELSSRFLAIWYTCGCVCAFSFRKYNIVKVYGSDESKLWLLREWWQICSLIFGTRSSYMYIKHTWHWSSCWDYNPRVHSKNRNVCKFIINAGKQVEKHLIMVKRTPLGTAWCN